MRLIRWIQRQLQAIGKGLKAGSEAYKGKQVIDAAKKR